MEIAAIDLHVLRAGLRSPWGVLCVETRSGEREIATKQWIAERPPGWLLDG